MAGLIRVSPSRKLRSETSRIVTRNGGRSKLGNVVIIARIRLRFPGPDEGQRWSLSALIFAVDDGIEKEGNEVGKMVRMEMRKRMG